MKTNLKGKGNLKLSLTDMFNTVDWQGIQEFADFYVDTSGGWESRQIRFNFSYLFGNNEVKKSRKRKTGLEYGANRVR